MKRTFAIVTAIMTIFLLSTAVIAGASELTASLAKQVDSSPNASAELKTFVKSNLLPLCTNEVFVKTVAAQNAKGMTLDEIKQTDETWRSAEDFLPIHEELLSNECAAEIKRIAKNLPQITETFVMDNQGANVGQNQITSDYWQGDEAKWENSFKGGKGGVDIGEAKLYKSTNRIDQKVSLPIIDTSGKVIGAICFGIAL